MSICIAMSRPEIAFKEYAPVQNQPWDWTDEKTWGQGRGMCDDNYYIFYPKFNSEPTPKIPTPPETDFSPIWILEKEILVNIPVNWDKDHGTKSNILVENIEQIKIKEKTNEVGGKRIHELYSDGTCDHKDESDDEEEPDECGESLVGGIYCDQAYTFNR